MKSYKSNHDLFIKQKGGSGGLPPDENTQNRHTFLAVRLHKNMKWKDVNELCAKNVQDVQDGWRVSKHFHVYVTNDGFFGL